MCETLNLIPSIKRERRGKGRKEEKGGTGEREAGRKGRRRRGEGRREGNGGKRKTEERERKEEGNA